MLYQLRFCTAVEYVKPSASDLKEIFGRHVSIDASEEIRPIDRCKDVDKALRPMDFFYLFPGAMSDAQVLSEHDRLEVRPALYEEAVCLARYLKKLKVPSLFYPDVLVVRGSELAAGGDDDRRCCPVIGRRIESDDKIGFGRGLIPAEWPKSTGFLVVREYQHC